MEVKTEIGADLTNMYTKEELLDKAGAYGNVQAVDFKTGPSMHFIYDEERGIVMELPDRQIPLNADAVRHMLRTLGVPASYHRKTPDQLFIPHLDYYFRETMADKTGRVLLQDGVAVATSLKPRNDYVTIPELVDVAEKALGKKDIVGFHKPQFDWFRSVINVVLNETFEVKDKDPLNIGIRFEISLNEANPLKAMAYTFRQWCSNGAITMDKVASFRSNSSDASGDSFRKWIPSVVVDAKKALELEKGRLLALAEIKTNKDTAVILDHLLITGGVPAKVRERVTKEAIDADTDNLYDVWNVLTNVATHSDFGTHASIQPIIESVAAGLAKHTKLCPACHRPEVK